MALLMLCNGEVYQKPKSQSFKDSEMLVNYKKMPNLLTKKSQINLSQILGGPHQWILEDAAEAMTF